ncbi:ciliated left-right organizer metallopeptidase isoform X4 [Nerophis ophidion]|uniref:ciliated left-right organizer metallopeptidase isoform X4 n=1 Tax=Nerophis ophidion TaxID=159077 RepID=UPI002AE02673|nr:ciliated left-right organizer metallopeptidase isoform X4 [Nerophis ophidion]
MAPSQAVCVCLLLLTELPASCHKCIFDKVQARVRVVRGTMSPPDGPPGHQKTLQNPTGKDDPTFFTSPQPIRIQSWLSRESDHLSEWEKGRMMATVDEALRMMTSLLSGANLLTTNTQTGRLTVPFLTVQRASTPLLLRRDVTKYCKFLWKNSSTINYNRCGRANGKYRTETCLHVTIPDEHLAGCEVLPEADSTRRIVLRPHGTGLPNVDFLLYLHIQAADKCRAEVPSLLAYAAHCQVDTRGRPLAGVVVICRDRLTTLTVPTVVHELFHALGFSKDLFHTWTDCSSQQVGAHCSPRGKVTHSDGSGQMRIYTPSVISALQMHLGAVDPELGGPLENFDVPAGGVSSHWEARVLQGSIMLAVRDRSSSVHIDPVTLAAFKDTGWYTVNMSKAQNLVWGQGGGAMFGSTSTCMENSSSFFCTGSGLGCHYLHLHKGECQTDPLLDGCRLYKELKNGSECWSQENEKKSPEEIFGLDSRCFFSSLTPHVSTKDAKSKSCEPILCLLSQNQSQLLVSGRCYRHRCTAPNSYQIQMSLHPLRLRTFRFSSQGVKPVIWMMFQSRMMLGQPTSLLQRQHFAAFQLQRVCWGSSSWHTGDVTPAVGLGFMQPQATFSHITPPLRSLIIIKSTKEAPRIIDCFSDLWKIEALCFSYFFSGNKNVNVCVCMNI